jgi:hypothetical protein
VFDFSDLELGRLAGYDTVFGAGNAVTGKGNIVASRKHSVQVASHLIENFLGLEDNEEDAEGQLLEDLSSRIHESVEKLVAWVGTRPKLDAAQVEAILQRVRARQAAVGYSGSFREWLERVSPKS